MNEWLIKGLVLYSVLVTVGVIHLYRTRTKLNNILGYFERRETLLCDQIHDLRNRNLKIRKNLPDKFKH